MDGSGGILDRNSFAADGQRACGRAAQEHRRLRPAVLRVALDARWRTTGFGRRDNALFASNKPADILKARDLIEAKPSLVTPMAMTVLAIRLYDIGARDDAVFWFYVAKNRFLTLMSVIDMEAAGLDEVGSAMGAFAQLAGPTINGYAFCDLAKQAESAAKAIDWVAAHPYDVILSEKLPAMPGDRRANLDSAVASLRNNADKERDYLADRENLAAFKATRAQNDAGAKFCWK